MSKGRAIAASGTGLGGLRPEPASSLRHSAPIPIACRNCGGEGWVCENHRDTPWQGGNHTCCGGAGAPCGACNLKMAADGFVYLREQAIAQWLASTEPSYSGWNDHDEHFDRGWNSAIEWAALSIATGKHWPFASAIEARRAETQSGSVADESAVPQGDAQP